MLTLGLGQSLTANGGSEASAPVEGGGGGDYATGAVAFDGATFLVNSSLVAGAASGLFSMSAWYFLPSAPESAVPWVSAPDDVYGNYDFFTSDAAGGSQVNLIDIDATNAISFGSEGAQQLPTGEWFHLLFSADVNHPDGEKPSATYLNGVLVANASSDGQPAFQIAMDALPFNVGSDGFGNSLTGYMADFWLTQGQSLLNAGGTIDPETIAKFYSDGKPVDLGADGSTPTGTAPAVFLSGVASSFATNRGTGGSFTITGALTDAPSSPSD